MTMIDRLFAWVRGSALLYRFTLFTRALLIAGFIPTGMVKLLGRRFTSLGLDSPVGAFFECMYQTGFYWRFLGFSQVLAAVLLVFPRTAHLGAAIFLPIMLNIFVITVSVGFTGTPVITGLMVLAAAYLCFWDYDRFRPLLTRAPLERQLVRHRLDPWESAGFVVFTLALVSFFGLIRSLFPRAAAPILLVVGTLAGLFTLSRFLWLRWKKRLEPGDPS